MLQRFGNNFDSRKTRVRFPKVICCSRDVVIETFENGLYINKLVTDEQMVILIFLLQNSIKWIVMWIIEIKLSFIDEAK